MGFTTANIVTTAASVASKAVEGIGQQRQSRALRKAADATKQLADERAGAITDTALSNQRLEQRNASDTLATARADAAASGLAAEGSVAQRETDLATRLQTEIRNRTNAALTEANDIRRQGTLDAWDLRQRARNARTAAIGSGLGALGSVFQGIGNAVGGSSGSSSDDDE